MAVHQLQSRRNGPSNEDLNSSIRSRGQVRIVEAGTHLFEQADRCKGAYLVESGLIGLRKLDEDGSTMLVNLARPGDFVGYSTALTEGEHEESAEVLQTSRVIFLDLPTMRRLIGENPRLLPALLRQATRDLRALEEKHLQMATRQAHVRLAALLLSFDQDTGDGSRASRSFPLPVMNRDLADLIGIRPETLSRALGQLRAAGLAELRGRIVSIPSVAKLARLSGCSHVPAFNSYAA